MNLKFPFAEQISGIKEPLNWNTEKTAIMVAACREMAEFHAEHCPEIAAMYRRHGFEPSSIRTEEDLRRIPPLGVSAMKTYLLTSLPHESAVLKLTSSGTRGQKTQIWFDQASLDRVQKMLDVYLDQEGLVSTKPTNYLVLNYDPDQAGDLGIAYTEKNQLRFAPVNHVFYAIRKNLAGTWAFEKDRAAAFLKEYTGDGKPVRIFAMPAFLFEFVQYLKERNEEFQFSLDSLILTGGGWKAAEDKKISRERFREMCADCFGILLDRQRDAYGMAEHCAPYFECRKHRFHVAAFNRILIRDPITNDELPAGKPGLMELITPFNAMMPTLAILSTDYGVMYENPCPCGFQSPTFLILGRAGLSKHKGCALTANEIVRRNS